MTSRPSLRRSLKTGYIPTAATAVLLFALAAASLGCAYVACFGVAEAPASQRSAAPALRQAVPMAVVAAPGRCAGARARRMHCRAAYLPAV